MVFSGVSGEFSVLELFVGVWLADWGKLGGGGGGLVVAEPAERDIAEVGVNGGGCGGRFWLFCAVVFGSG